MSSSVKMTKDSSRKQSVSSLAELCLKSSLKYLESFKIWDERLNTFLPEDICTALISKKLSSGHCDDEFVSTYLADVKTSRITKVHMSGARITDLGLEFISRHPLREVDISYCEVSEKTLVSLAKCRNTLTSLKMIHCRQITEFKELRHLIGLKSLDVSDTWLDDRNGTRCFADLVNLRMLNLSGTEIVSLDPLNTLAMLTSLDLSLCREIESIKPLENIRGSLQWLSLYNCRKLFSSNQTLLESLGNLTKLQHLDLSKHDPDEIVEMEGFLNCSAVLVNRQFLERLLPSLPNLDWLDLSGNAKFSYRDFDLFNQYRSKMLRFLGLFGTEMCLFHEIPADEVSGRRNMKQVTFSVSIYHKRPEFLVRALQDLFNFLSTDGDDGFSPKFVCNVVLGAMESRPKDKRVQLAGSASLYHLSRDEDGNVNLSEELKRRIIEVIIGAMDYHVAEEQLQKNCCLTLCNFRIPSDLPSDFRKIVEVLLRTATIHKPDLIQRIAIGICNMVVCQIQDSPKIVVGRDLKGVEKILQIIRYKMGNNPELGGVMEGCWSALWNMTDETPENCALFIVHGGLELFRKCHERMSDRRDLVRNMLGLMGNVAEVAGLRPKLMPFVHVFYELLLTEGELEVTYNAGGIVSHLAFDGVNNWTSHTVSRTQALQRLAETVDKWDIETARQMSYRSFAPILKLISGCDTPEIHYWATWALANLCNVEPEKYCKLVTDEGGVELLQDLHCSPRTSQRVRELADQTLRRCRLHAGND
ncbi:protein zer-1 homolog isoform X2 [Stylophora pistillata]|uniref:protein zer-1 homolog isoform X2 n=1 Tax=Stylophora pistillata TaxID=50429 RepID=UPI000C0475B0|nr:protein zer-1 homolog isoform X2 [Stylophora pistillata]